MPKAYFEPTRLVFPERDNKILKGGGREVIPPFFPETERRVRGSQAAAVADRGTKIIAGGVGDRGVSAYMNPSWEEGKPELGGELGGSSASGEGIHE